MCKTFYTFLHGLLSITAEGRWLYVFFMVNLHGEVKLEIEENFILQTLSCKLEFTKHVNCILQDVIFTCAVNFQLFQ